MLVTVVMPSFNQAGFIERSVRSVLAEQGVSWELIIMDGGSSDGTQTLLHRLAQEADGRLHWISEADRGPAHAVNKAMALARGSVVGWLNSDDVYLPGAIERAVQALDAHPEWLMVYGHGQHIDTCDQVIGNYPTYGPDTPIQVFADGCFICQPTVFFRKTMVDILGGLDEKLKTAFDFEWWLRLFTRYPKRVGFVDAVQAGSRLHGAGLTLGQRETVIREGMQLVTRYLGACPLHWFKTYMNEVLAEYPQGRQIDDLKTHLRAFANMVADCLTAADQEELSGLLENDARIQLALPDACLQVYPDGWLPARSALRIRCRDRIWRRVEIRGRHISKVNVPLRLEFRSPNGRVHIHRIKKRGPFSLQIKLPAPSDLPVSWIFSIDAQGGFVPREHDPESDDGRELVCKIDSIRLHTTKMLFMG